jgi:hypothetical protein
VLKTLPLALSLEKRGGILFKNKCKNTILFLMDTKYQNNFCSEDKTYSAPLLFSREGAGTKRAPLEGMSFLIRKRLYASY